MLKIIVSRTVRHAWFSDCTRSLMLSPFRMIEIRDLKLDGKYYDWQSIGKNPEK